ncbi:EamA family transporter [Paraburkholderia flagellata]|uniref:EamA family transporter n=1 Tax=Paraburkholderia flagellata TaxID=2883241 RepID=UPI001F2E0AF1|nr:EamA family transporter [Paraburkholderia flagellata]
MDIHQHRFRGKQLSLTQRLVFRSAATSPFLPYVALLVAMVSIQYGATFAKRLFPVVGAEGTTALRLGIASLILIFATRAWRTNFSSRKLPVLLVYGASLGAMNLLFYMALRRIPLGLAVALEFLGPFALAVVSSRRWLDFVWIGLAATGLLLLLPLYNFGPAIDPIGVLLALAAGGFWALYSVFGQLAGEEHGVSTAALGTTIAAVLVVPIGLAQAGTSLFNPGVLLSAVVVAVFSSALPFSLEIIALVRLPTRVYGTLTSVEPAIGAFTGWLFLHESLTAIQMLAIGTIVTASIGTAATHKPVVPAN